MSPASMRPVALLAVVALMAAVPFAVYPILLCKILCLALFACAFNLLMGYGGLLSFGHAAFFGVGAYAAGYAIRSWALTPELALLLGTAAALSLGVAVGALAIRRHGIYFSMITLALAQTVYFACLQAPFTGGEDGLQGVGRGRLLGLIPLADDRVLYALVAAVFAAGLWFIRRVTRSPFGEALRALREDEQRALSLGYDVDRLKLVAFALSAALAGLAGATKTLVFGFATLSDVHWHLSGEVILMTLVGGVGTTLGPVVGATVMVLLQDLLADKVGSKVTVITGVVFMACVLGFRKGVVGSALAWRERGHARRSPAASVPPQAANESAGLEPSGRSEAVLTGTCGAP